MKKLYTAIILCSLLFGSSASIVDAKHSGKRPRKSNKKKKKAKKGKALPSNAILNIPEQSFDGSGNNIENKDWGSTGIELIRVSDVTYKDSISELSTDLPSARLVSNNIAKQDEAISNERPLTDMLWQWGQFLDHDIDLTDPAVPAEEANIPVPLGDPSFDPFSTGTQIIGFSRSQYSDSDSVRQQTNSITAFIDASNLYGSDETRANALRTFNGGSLKTSAGNLLPFNEDGLENAGGPGANLFLAGDVRANEQLGLTSMHTLWLREHNYMAHKYKKKYPEMPDEAIYQMTRRHVIAEMQAITYNEFLPTLLGNKALSPYSGYKAEVNPSIMNEFSTAAYRFGHSALSSTILRLDNNGDEIPEGNLSLLGAFFRPDLLDSEESIGYILKGLASQRMQQIDNKVIDDVRNFLFGPPGNGGFDLVSLNIQRCRDHGLPYYNQARRDWGLEARNSFSEISSDQELNQALEETYGDLEKIDLWVGILAEDHPEGSSVGELARTIIAKQFENLRDGDRFFYKNLFRGKALKEIEKTKLSDIIRRNTQIKNLQRQVFKL